MSISEKKLTEQEFKVLLYLMWLDRFDDPDYPDYTVGQKIDVYGSEPMAMDALEFFDILDKLVGIGLMEMDDINDMYELTELGQKHLKRIGSLDGLVKDDFAVKIWNGTVSIQDFIKEYGVDILSTVAQIIFA